MRIDRAFFLALLLAATPAWAGDDHHAEHGGQLFHGFELELEHGPSRHGPVTGWDFDGWVGGDRDKLWLKAEGEHEDGGTAASELWALYSRNVDSFWDLQLGIRHDTAPRPLTCAVAGVDGLAPWFLETEAHVFACAGGPAALRLRQERDLLLTQRLITQPWWEANAQSGPTPGGDTGGGLTEIALGLQTRYEFTRQLAPYIDLHAARKFGPTAGLARAQGDPATDYGAALGVRLMF